MASCFKHQDHATCLPKGFEGFFDALNGNRAQRGEEMNNQTTDATLQFLRSALEGVWTGSAWESYVLSYDGLHKWGHQWSCIRKNRFQKKFTVVYDEKSNFIWWGLKGLFFLDPHDLMQDPNAAAWYARNDKSKERPKFVWHWSPGPDECVKEDFAAERSTIPVMLASRASRGIYESLQAVLRAQMALKSGGPHPAHAHAKDCDAAIAHADDHCSASTADFDDASAEADDSDDGSTHASVHAGGHCCVRRTDVLGDVSDASAP